MRIKGKAAVVTGGASGLGAACVRMLHDEGAKVAIVDLDEKRAAEQPGDLVIPVDVTDAAKMEDAMNAARKLFGRIDIAVLCAGIAPPRRILGKEGPMALDAFARVINVNLIGAFNVARLAAAAMASNEPDEAGERGVIVMTASIAAFEGQIGQCAYAASKAGIAGLTLPMARDLARHAVRVMTIAPGIFDTPLLAGLPEEARTSLAAGVPFPAKLGQPEQFAALAKHIVENSYLNGETIRLDAALRMGPK